MENNLEKLNSLWSMKAGHVFTEEELQEELKENPNFWKNYYLQEQLAKKYRDNA